MLIFFDVLFMDGQSLLQDTYDTRRETLEGLITEIEGFSKIASRTAISMRKGDPCRTLESILSTSASKFEEGLVLKADVSTYNSRVLPWVKLKRDYIAGLGDCIDMAVIGASWEKERARELRVGTDTFTTFYVAALTDQGKPGKPHLECLFTASYGLSKEQLEALNFEIKLNTPVPYNLRDKVAYTFQLCPGLNPPSVIFQKPMLFELFGAGYDKPKGSKYYALRWPRATKYFSTEERPWTECETLQSYTKKAYAAVGRDSSDKIAKAQVAKMWQVPPEVSPEARGVKKRTTIEQDMRGRLRGKKQLAANGSIPGPHRSSRVACSRSGIRRSLPHLDQHPDPLQLLEPGGYPSDSSQSPRKRRKVAARSNRSDEVGYLAPSQPDSEPEAHLQAAEMEDAEEVDWYSTVAMDSQATSVVPTSSPNLSPAAPWPYLELILIDAFIFFDWPIYPRPVRLPGEPSRKLGLDPSRVVSTLEALLVAINGATRLAQMRKPIKRGIIFTENTCAPALISRLESYREQLGNIRESPEILVIPMPYFDMYRSRVSAGLLIVDVLWRSHQ